MVLLNFVINKRRIQLIVSTDLSSVFANNITSFANNKWEIYGPLFDARIGDQFFCSTFRIIKLRYYIQRMNKYEERGFPCLIPRDRVKAGSLDSFSKIEIIVVKTQLVINVIQWDGKPKEVITLRIKLYSNSS